MFCYLAKLQKLPKEPWLWQVPKLPAADDEDESPEKKLPLDEEPADPKSVAAPVELADCANAVPAIEVVIAIAAIMPNTMNIDFIVNHKYNNPYISFFYSI